MRNNRCIQIYKYRGLSGKYGREAIERALAQNQLYWQSPAEFNDPFDCFPVLHFGDDATQRDRFYERAAEKYFGHLPLAERKKRQSEMSKAPAAAMEERLCREWGNWISNSAITCFSEVNDHPLMWGHYADSHKGVCLIFDEIANEQTEWFAFPVSYQAARPRVNLTRFHESDVMMQALFLKSDHWSYEKEQRMIDWDKAPGYREFPEQLLKGIILGARIDTNDESFVRDLLAKRPRLQTFKAKIDASEFRLCIEPA
jgi:hypothetical protein